MAASATGKSSNAPQGLLAQGAAGIVYGRNVIQHPNPAGITRALMAMVHENADVETALALIG